MKLDYNICEHCNLLHGISTRLCPECGQALVLDSHGKIAIWRLGMIEDGILGPVSASIRAAFKCDVVIQPTYLDERPSARPHWSGRSATVIINQMLNRKDENTFANICITEENITLNKRYNFLFGLAWLGLGASVVSLAAMRSDSASPERLRLRAAQIAIHELGHAFGLDDQPYSHADCVMCGEVEYDSIQTIDEGCIEFCPDCLSELLEKRGLPV